MADEPAEDDFQFLKYEMKQPPKPSQTIGKTKASKKPFEFDKISNLKSVLVTRKSSKNNSGTRTVGERRASGGQKPALPKPVGMSPMNF